MSSTEFSHINNNFFVSIREYDIPCMTSFIYILLCMVVAEHTMLFAPISPSYFSLVSSLTYLPTNLPFNDFFIRSLVTCMYFPIPGGIYTTTTKKRMLLSTFSLTHSLSRPFTHQSSLPQNRHLSSCLSCMIKPT